MDHLMLLCGITVLYLLKNRLQYQATMDWHVLSIAYVYNNKNQKKLGLAVSTSR